MTYMWVLWRNLLNFGLRKIKWKLSNNRGSEFSTGLLGLWKTKLQKINYYQINNYILSILLRGVLDFLG